MQEIPADHPALPALFAPDVPNHPGLWAVFRGRHTGQALVDDPERPARCVVRTDAQLTFSSRGVEPSFMAEAIQGLRRVGPLLLVRTPEQAALGVPPGCSCVTQRLEFFDYDAHSPGLAALRAGLPAGLSIRCMDRSLLERCEWRDDMKFYCGSLENFLANAAGLCLMDGETIVAEAYASSFGWHDAEIGVLTRAGHRGRGCAPIACAYLIELCEARGYSAYWSCDADNLPSIRVAEKLGFRQRRAYAFYEYGALK